MIFNSASRKNLKQKFAMVLSVALVLSNLSISQVYAGSVSGGDADSSTDQKEQEAVSVSPENVNDAEGEILMASSVSAGDGEYVLEMSDVESILTQDPNNNGRIIKAGTDNYFELLLSEKTKINASEKTFIDNYIGTQRFNFGAKVSTEKDAIKFTTQGAASIKIYWACGDVDVDRQITILNSAGSSVDITEEVLKKNDPYISTLNVTEAGTYYLGATPKSNYIFKVIVTEENSEPVEETHTFNATAIDATGLADKNPIANGTSYDNGYFITFGTEATPPDLPITIVQRINSDQKTTSVEVGKAESSGLKFTVTGTASATIKMSSNSGSNTSAVGLLNGEGAMIPNKENITTIKGTAEVTLTYENLAAGTYYIVSPEDNNNKRGARLYSATVVELVSGTKPPRADWSTLIAPTISTINVGQSDIVVNFDALIGYDGADRVRVDMMNQEGIVVDARTSAVEGTNGSVTFVPKASGVYTFVASAIRADHEEKASAPVTADHFSLPLTKPYVSGASNLGKGDVTVIWEAVTEAEKYRITIKDNNSFSQETTETETIIKGLTIGETYTIEVVAIRGGDESKAGTKEITVKDVLERTWMFAAFGDSTSVSKNSYEGDAKDGSVRIISKGGGGKIVPGSTDGIGFHYTKLNAAEDNFTLKAKVKVNSWKLSNGQEGFGLMVSDAVGTHGDSNSFWNNSYMINATKVEYLWDADEGKVSNVGDKIIMKQGIGAQEKIGATGPNTDVANFKQSMTPLETSCGPKGTGTYNIIGGYEEPVEGTIENPMTEFYFELTRNNTGYLMSYTDANGQTTSKLYYDIERDNLNVIDPENIYVGFFTARNADITFSDIELTTINTKDDAPAEGREIVEIAPNYQITSASTSNNAAYNLVFKGNADGKITVTTEDGTIIAQNEEVKADQDWNKTITLKRGTNKFSITMTPNAGFKPSEYEVLTSYEPKTLTHTVVFESIEGKNIYVSPTGTSNGDGRKANPMDIYTAVKYVSPGQTIVLEGGHYNLSSTVRVERGINGTSEQMITMMGNPNSATRPVLDFGSKCAGMVLAGDYWYFKDFDVTKSSNAQKGVQISGSYNVVDRVDAYYNGNTGIQISRYLSSDGFDKWPSNNLILNCTSYGNADRGYEDADGFAAKLTIGEGNVFDGCIAYNNADDGWDLFARVDTGIIGKVVIKNSVAYNNGFLMDGTSAGNGNGFKLGGSSITGKHELINCVAFNNKAKGIDSNSCPDIYVENSTTFNNGSYNVALYTKNINNTDFEMNGVLSYRTENKSMEEEIKGIGTQDSTKIYNYNNYYWNEIKEISENFVESTVNEDWFVSVSNPMITRHANGIINMNGFLELTNIAPSDTGARMTGTASRETSLDERPLGVIVGEAKDKLVSIDINTNPEEARTIATEVIESLVDCDWRQFNVNSTEVIRDLEEIEEIIAEVFNVRTIIEIEENALTVTVVNNALLSVEQGKNAVIKVTNTDVPQTSLPVELNDKQLSSAVAFDLSLLSDGIEMELRVPVVLRIELPQSIDTNKDIVFLHYKNDGTVETLTWRIEGNEIVTTTSSFSAFVIANLDEVSGGGNDNGGNNGGGENNTGQEESNNNSNAKVNKTALKNNKKSPSTYDDSLFLAGKDNNNDEKPAPSVPVIDQNAEKIAASIVANNNYNLQWGVILIALAIVGIALVVGMNAYHKAKKEE